MMGRPTFKGYVEGVEGKSGKTLEGFWRLAMEKGFVNQPPFQPHPEVGPQSDFLTTVNLSSRR